LLRGDSYREVFANRSFTVLWAGQALAHLGQSITYVAVALYVYELTGSARDLSIALALQLLPWMVVGPVVGMLADHLGRKAILVVAYALQAALVALLPFTTTLGQIYALVFLSGLMAPVTELTWAAALPSIVGQGLFVRGVSLEIVAFNAVNVVGPTAAGLLTSLVGARPVFFVVVACYLGATALALQASIPGPPKPDEPLSLRGLWRGQVEAIQLLSKDRILRYLVLLDVTVALGVIGPDIASLVYLTDTLQLGGREYGLLRGTVSFSMALGVFVLGQHASRLARQYMLLGGVLLVGLAYALAGTGPSAVLLFGLWFVSGLGWAASWLTADSLYAEVTPDAVRGRVYSIAAASYALAEAGTATLAGWMVNKFGPGIGLYVIGGAISLGAIAVAGLSGGHRAIARFNPNADGAE